MFPTAHSTVYYNEVGEPLGWSDESNVEAEFEDFDRFDDPDDEECEYCGSDSHSTDDCPQRKMDVEEY